MFIEKNVVNGIWFETKETINIQNPATKEILGSVPRSGVKEATQAVDAAANALAPWSGTTAYERSKLLKKWHD